ncbi:hypothetical protein ABZP36_034952 [Zizania latifolia]
MLHLGKEGRKANDQPAMRKKGTNLKRQRGLRRRCREKRFNHFSPHLNFASRNQVSKNEVWKILNYHSKAKQSNQSSNFATNGVNTTQNYKFTNRKHKRKRLYKSSSTNANSE